jgi:SAM-dependent methyltransferase
LFKARGCRVLGVEVDERMASYARRLGFDVETVSFEDWATNGRSFDLIVSGQAWHWIEPVRGAYKAAEVLRPGGRIGMFWNRACHPPEVQSRFDAVYHAYAPGLEGYSIVLGHGTGDRFEIAARGLQTTGRFGPVEQFGFPWATTYTRDEWLDSLMTHSDHQALPAADRDRLLHALGEVIDQLGGSFSTAYETHLVTAAQGDGGGGHAA